jgi:uncharacterized protein YceK
LLVMDRCCLPLLIVVVLLSGCSTTIDADDFDQSCTEASDCTAVWVGDICNCDCFSVAAINVDELAEYQEQRDGISCTNECGPCANSPYWDCRDGQCRIF